MVLLQINTTQNVNISFNAASIGERILAFTIDWVIKIAYSIVIYQILFRIINIENWIKGLDYWSIMAIYVMFYFPVIVYSLIFESLLEGQTPGKRILKIKVIKIDGYQASLTDFMTRWFFRLIDLNLFSPIFGPIIAIISIIINDKNQRLGDIAAGTSVISLKNDITINHTLLENIEQAYSPTYSSVIKLSDKDVRIIKDSFRIAKSSNDFTTLIKLREKIMEVIHIKEISHKNDLEFIETILKDYNFYTQNG